MAGRVYITGIGVISAIGNNVGENLRSLKAEKTGIGKIEILETNFRNDYLAGEVKVTNHQLACILGINPDLNLPRTTLLAITAAKEAIQNAGLDLNDPYRTGIIAGTTVGGMDKTEKYYYHTDQNSDFIKSHSCGNITEQVAKHLGITDYITTLNTACSSGANAILHGARLIQHGLLDRVVAGGFDALTKFTINGFKSLFILSPGICAPFDKNRNGLNLGEGAGFIVLESEALVTKSGKKPLCTLSGFANANDAFHQTASSPNGEGAFITMKKALERACISVKDISYINLHGTGTENNDLSEGIALKRLFGNNIPPFSSTKSYIGHTLGAAGGIEAVFSVLSITENLIFPNLFFKNPIEELGFSPVKDIILNAAVKNIMSNSFGFGGNDTTLIFSLN
jgi:3-oxoacyl-[acyl-carrier-protein] synthase II